MFENYSKSRTREFLDSILRMAYLAEIKEWDNRTHLERIRKYCYVIGTDLGMSAYENGIISNACQLHDIGKTMMPDALLNKAGNFEAVEWKVIELHTVNGAKILENSHSPTLQVGATIALTHHERWDGSGYPNRLRKEDIPIGGRICAIADVFDALTTKRSYKKMISFDDALALIVESSGKLFDPAVVTAFKNHYDEICRICQTNRD
jgi:putative two-component system response regulator